jgi:hypothetical protein
MRIGNFASALVCDRAWSWRWPWRRSHARWVRASLLIWVESGVVLPAEGKGGIHHRHHHRHARFFFAGGPWFANYGYDCWRWTPTPWGPRRVWVCDYY